MSVNQIVTTFLSNIVFVVNHFKANLKIRSLLTWLLVALSDKQELLGYFHARSYKDINGLGFLAHSSSVQANNLTLVTNLFA